MRTHLYFQIFFIPFYLFLFGVSAICQIDQQSILIQLKNELHFNSSLSSKLKSWNPNAGDCCTWVGVNCSLSGQVIGLDLSNETISSAIDDSSALFGLKNLETLNLAGNNFNFTPITSGFGSLTSLRNLNLSNSLFSGQIPVELSQLTNLEILDLSSLFSMGIRSLKLENPNLAMLVGNLTQLRVLYLDSVNISAQKSDWCQALSPSLLQLEVLSLSNCQLSGPLVDSLGKLQSLSVLRLAQNNLSASIPDFFGDFRNLTVLNLGNCNLRGTFPTKVIQLQNLQILDLSVNTNLHGSLSDFHLNGSLRSLVLSNTNISGAIPESIGNLKSLSRMELPRSNFSGRIPKSMENLTQLLYLDLSSNQFIGQIPSFHLCKNVTHIDLSRNNLSGTIPSAHFQDLQNLVYIDLRFNAFSGSVPSSLFNLQQIQKIQLSNNNFDGVLANFSNPSASLLDTLDLSSNNLKGPIPKSFFQLVRLNILLLSSNNLSGIIETKDFQGLINLTNLDLSFNSLSIITSPVILPRLPKLFSLRLASCNLHKFPNLHNQTKMINLDLSDNKIVGEIPSWIWGVGSGGLSYLNLSRNQLTGLQTPYVVPNLSVLDLHSNLLSGMIPVPPQTATFIDYSDNLFNSSLPESIGVNLTFAYFFSVSNNLLIGKIPETICNATYLKVLDLSNNQLSGRIPRCLIESGGSELGVLNLGNNSLDGRIEGIFPSFCGLNTLDLHGNYLEGEIPRSLANCNMLEVLNLGNNKMNDIYPCYLRNNTSLRVLVLRSNEFYGTVRCSEQQRNNWSKIQILDIAHNNFNGTVPADCFWQWDAMMTSDDGEASSKKHLSFKVLPLTEFYYQDTVTVTIKGLELELVKILTLFTSVDISSNNFSGEIPRTIGRLSALYMLNVSHNEFTGSIPPSIGNLSQLESLDMSSNKLNGEIPPVLASLSFLSFLDLSYNQLKGRIPTGSQFQTFTDTSYTGNKGLCGFPLSLKCSSSDQIIPKNAPIPGKSNAYDSQFIVTGVGFGAGAATVTVPLVLSKQGRNFWDKYTNKIVKMICLVFGIHYAAYGLFNQDEDDEKQSQDSDENSDEDEFLSEVDQSKGRYCVFCTKLDFSRKLVIHDANCTCFDRTPRLSTSVSTSSSEAESPFTKL